MPDIVQEFPIKAPPARVFWGISTPEGLDQWWTKRSSGTPETGAVYELDFGPGYLWKAAVTRCEPEERFELELVEAQEDWQGSRVGFALVPQGESTVVHFHHLGWPEDNSHYRGSCFCWAMYLRILKRHLEHGESVPYEERLNV